MAGALLHPGRLAHQLHAQRGARRRPDRRAARRGCGVAGRCRRGAGPRRIALERGRDRRAPGLSGRTRGRGRDPLRPARGHRRRDGRDHGPSPRHGGRGPGKPPGPRLPPDRRRGHASQFRRHHAGRAADPHPPRVRHHRRRLRSPPAFVARHPGSRRHAGVRRQHHPRVRRLDRHGVQPGQLRGADHRHDRRRRALGAHRGGRPRGHETRPRAERGRRRIASRQCLARVPHHRHHRNRIPEPERLRRAALPGPRQPGGIRRAVRLRVLHDAAAGAAVHPAAACASRPRGPARIVRSPRRLRGRSPHVPALVRRSSDRRPGHGHSPHRADRQLDAVLRRALRVPARHRLRHREPDRDGDAGVLAERRARGRRHRPAAISARSTPSPSGSGPSPRWCTSRPFRTS